MADMQVALSDISEFSVKFVRIWSRGVFKSFGPAEKTFIITHSGP